MRFQVYKIDPITIRGKESDVSKIQDSYLVSVNKDMVYLYILDRPEAKKQVLQRLKDIAVVASPESYENLNGKKEYLYVKEFQVRKHLKKVNTAITVKEGDIVTTSKYKKMPFVVTDVHKHEVTISHNLRDMCLELKVPLSDIKVVDENTEVAPFYNFKEEPLKVCKLFIDCDIYDIDEDFSSLVKDILTVKTIYNKYEVIVLNPNNSFINVLEVLGLRSYCGNKRTLYESNIYDKDLDLVLTDCTELLYDMDRILYWGKYLNITFPDLLQKDSVVCHNLDRDSDGKNYTGFKEITPVKDLSDLDFESVSTIFKNSPELQHLVGDLSYFIRVIK